MNATEKLARLRRDAGLQSSDWTQIPDCTVDKQAWLTYRQALRDLPTQPGFPHEIVWPRRPDYVEETIPLT